jgi:hypothetical protein
MNATLGLLLPPPPSRCAFCRAPGACCCRTEDELKAAGAKYKKGVFPFMANSRSRANGEGKGLVKILADADTDRVLGVHIVGASAGELIAEVRCVGHCSGLRVCVRVCMLVLAGRVAVVGPPCRPVALHHPFAGPSGPPSPHAHIILCCVPPIPCTLPVHRPCWPWSTVHPPRTLPARATPTQLCPRLLRRQQWPPTASPSTSRGLGWGCVCVCSFLVCAVFDEMGRL